MESPVSAINGVWYWHRDPDHTFRCNSPSGHTVHYMERGSYELTLNGRVMTVREGDLVFYGSIEAHSWRGTGGAVSFYSVNYQPRDLTPLPDAQRLIATDGAPSSWFATAYEAFKEVRDPVQQARCFAAVYQILAYLRSRGAESGADDETTLWRSLEKLVLQKRLFRIPVQELARLSGYNESTVYRSCRAAHGEAPLARLRAIRLEEARNLLLHSTLPVSAVAAELGYPRIHEFSREFSRFEAQTPLEYRRNPKRVR